MRMAMVEMIGELIHDVSKSTELDKEKRDKKVSGLFELLGERFLDNSAYVRNKVMQTLCRLFEDMQIKYPHHRLTITNLAHDSLEDKNSSVRRAAIQLLSKLVTTHPYGHIYGGELSLIKWQERYEEMARALKDAEAVGELEKPAHLRDDVSVGAATEDEDEEADPEATPQKKAKNGRVKNEEDEEDTEPDDDADESMAVDPEESQDGTPRPSKSRPKRRKSDVLDLSALTTEQQQTEMLQGQQAMHHKLRKRYVAEGLGFIKQIEAAMLVIADLLGSKTKSEVLEAMDFFRITHEYSMDGAQQGIKKMLHLVWVKDNAAVDEDGKELKGIKARLIEVYRTLYFDALPDMEPKQQVNRITKNMIECVPQPH